MLNYPQGPEDHAGILDYATKVTEHARSYRLDIDRDATRNVLFYLGVQWITFDIGNRSWRPLALKRTTPRPVTNKIAPLVNTGVSMLVAFKPPITYGPANDADVDIAAANVADKINTVIEKETNIRYLKALVARWLWLTGNVFLISNYDVGHEHGSTFIPSQQCTNCGAVHAPMQVEDNGGMCPTCGQPFQGQPAIGPTGPTGTNYPNGKFLTEVENIFSTYFDPEAATLKESPYVLVSRNRPKSWVAETYGQDLANRVPSQTYSDPYKFYLETLAYTTASSGRSILGAGPRVQERVRTRRLWIRPNQERAPDGIYAVIVGDEVVESGPWPYHDESGKPMLNITHFQFDQVPGRLLAKTRVDDLVPKQRQRNELESILQLHSIRCANSIWLIPSGSGIQRISGEQGQLIRYTPSVAGHAPQRVPGDQGPAYIMEWLGRIDAEMTEIAGLSEVGKGEAPRGVSAYAALQLLDERSQQGQSNLMDNWATGFMDWSRINLNIWREYADEERTLSLGEGRWATERFSRAQLQGGVDLDVELGQNKPRTQVARRAVVDHAVRLALVNVGDPDERFRLLEIIGLPELMQDYRLDAGKASRENDGFANGQAVPPPMPLDNHQVHLMKHRRFIMAEAFSMLPPALQVAAFDHARAHQIMLQQQMMQQGPGQVAPKGKVPGAPGETKRVDDGGQAQQEAQLASPQDFEGTPAPVAHSLIQGEV